jgi:hypothetical protein
MLRKMSGVVRGGMLRLAAKVLDRAGDFAGLGVDGGHALAAAVGREHPLCFAIEQDHVRVRAYFYLIND